MLELCSPFTISRVRGSHCCLRSRTVRVVSVARRRLQSKFASVAGGATGVQVVSLSDGSLGNVSIRTTDPTLQNFEDLLSLPASCSAVKQVSCPVLPTCWHSLAQTILLFQVRDCLPTRDSNPGPLLSSTGPTPIEKTTIGRCD